MSLRCIIMGVAGCGKSSVGMALAERLDAVYIDGDDLHPQTNIDKMSAGIPLTDEDREPWLQLVGAAFPNSDVNCLIGCSALRKNYRDIIRQSAGSDVFFLHLGGTKQVITERMSQRTGHFMPTKLIDSQFATLERLERDESGALIDIDQSIEAVISACFEELLKVKD